MEESTGENVMVGTAMGRRSIYQFGRDLERSPKGNVDTGLGRTWSTAPLASLPPTKLIAQPTEEMALMVCALSSTTCPVRKPRPDDLSIPRKKVYGGAENLAMTMHNLLPVRGAKVRDSCAGAQYIRKHWMAWAMLKSMWPAQLANVGTNIAAFITQHRDVYKYTTTSRLRLMNAGLTPREIAETIKLPQSLQEHFGARGYYGDLRHNAKAVYQFYLGAYDGNPPIWILPPQESAKRRLEAMGGVDKTIAVAQTAYDRGEYRWAAELLNHAVFGDPTSKGRQGVVGQDV